MKTKLPDGDVVADVFARRRFTQRFLAVAICQCISACAAAFPLAFAVKAAVLPKVGTVQNDTEVCISLRHRLRLFSATNSTCCPNDLAERAMEILGEIRTEGLLSFVAVFIIAICEFTVTCANYRRFIDSGNIYLRKVVLNLTWFAAFILQAIICSTYHNGFDVLEKRMDFYCDDNSQTSTGLISCLRNYGACSKAFVRILWGFWALIIVSTVAIPAVTLYSCKWRKRVFAQLRDDLAYQRKSVLHSLQRSMLQGVKTDLEVDLEVERKTLQQLQTCLAEDYEMLKEFEESIERSRKTARHKSLSVQETLLMQEYHSYVKKLTEYNLHLSTFMNKAEALQELRKLDLEVLKNYTGYVNEMQKLEFLLAGQAENGARNVENGLREAVLPPAEVDGRALEDNLSNNNC